MSGLCAADFSFALLCCGVVLCCWFAHSHPCTVAISVGLTNLSQELKEHANGTSQCLEKKEERRRLFKS